LHDFRFSVSDIAADVFVFSQFFLKVADNHDIRLYNINILLVSLECNIIGGNQGDASFVLTSVIAIIAKLDTVIICQKGSCIKEKQ